MAIFDYVMLLISVVLSLGLARLLETHARLVKRGDAVAWSAVYVATTCGSSTSTTAGATSQRWCGTRCSAAF